MRFEKTLAFMGVSIAFMFLALLVGVFRLMSLNLLATGIFAGLYGLHSIIMVFGFLAAIIMTERVAGVGMFPAAECFRAPRVMVPLIMLGVVGEIIGYSWQLLIVRYLGALLLVAGCLAFIVTLSFQTAAVVGPEGLITLREWRLGYRFLSSSHNVTVQPY